MNHQMTGIVHLEDLPREKIYIGLKLPFFRSLSKQIREIGIFELARRLNVSKRIVNHWLSEGSLIRLDILVKICQYFRLNYSTHISHLRGKKGGRIFNPRLPFDFTSEAGVRLIAAILGDGGISQYKKCAHYTNTNKDLILGFLSDVNHVFGKIEYTSWSAKKKNSTVFNILIPPILSEAFFLIGLKDGKKVETNPHIPPFIFQLSDSHKYAFLSQLIDDEGSVNPCAKYICITSACLEKYPASHLLEDIQKLLFPFDILCSVYPGRSYLSSRGEPRRLWRLQINGSLQLIKLNQHLNLRSLKKREKLQFVVGSYKLIIFRKRDILETYIGFMRKIEHIQGYFTSLDLAQETQRSVGTCQNTLLKFKTMGLIACIRLPCGGDRPECGRYILDHLT